MCHCAGVFARVTAILVIDATANLNTGWNLDFRGGMNVSRHLLADLDFAYNRWNLTPAALATFGGPGGYSSI
jgi:hypothetical protein